MKPRLILDTDIGTDVDDAYALLLALGCRNIDLAAVTLVHAKLDIREKIALKMLKLAGRMDVPVAKGWSSTLSGTRPEHWGGHEGTDTDFSDIEGLHASDDAVDLMLRMVRENPGRVIIAAVGPLTNIADAIRRDLDAMRNVQKLVIMASVFKGTGPERASREHNANVDPEAAAIVLQSGLPITLVGLNTTLQVVITSDQIRRLRGTSPLGEYVADMGEQHLRLCGINATWMHDPLAVAIAARPDIAATVPLKAVVPLGSSTDGAVVYESAISAEAALDVCVNVDIPTFERLFFSSLDTAAKGAP